jgi:hypothetical protein
MTDNPDPRAEKAPGPISDTSHAPFIYFSGGTRCRRRPAQTRVVCVAGIR